MNDLEMTKLCAEAMGIDHDARLGHVRGWQGPASFTYDPLHDDAQAMALVKQFSMEIYAGHNTAIISWPSRGALFKASFAATLNRAIVECVAKMQEATRATKAA